MPDAIKDTFYEPPGRTGFVQRDVAGDGIQIIEGRLGPNYFSHRAIRFLARECDTTLPSAIALSPRAKPSSNWRRFCIAS